MPDSLLRVEGLVQGVGFRPFVWRLAQEMGLVGWVRNDAAGVTIRLCGEVPGTFVSRLQQEAPPLARVESIHPIAGLDTEPLAPTAGFLILDSRDGEVSTAIGPDAALCRDCLREITTPGNRRWRYALTTCTHCGPRYTVSHGIPYDRSRTSLADFPLCDPCLSEYQNPADRRFHAETTCCPDCGPQLSVLDANGQELAGDPLALTVSALRAGKIVAIKGIGGFHLACDARQETAIKTLRERKHREAKPFAVMGLNVASLRPLVQLTDQDEQVLTSPASPIVVCPRGDVRLPDGIAPGLNRIGVMLPTSPLHALLWHEVAGQPAWQDEHNWADVPSDFYLVMTSANPQGEPLVRDNDEAVARLSGIADLFLLHNRDIVIRCDDSVQLSETLGGTPIRRARGYTPLPIKLSGEVAAGPTVLALGGDLKNTLCVIKDDRAYLSQYVGSLDNVATTQFQAETSAHLLDILQAQPAVVAHDRHPDFLSSRVAVSQAENWGVPALGIGHHHAHIAAVCAEQGLSGPVLGLALDGVGLGDDNSAWGGELLRVSGASSTRLGHLQPLALPGGDRAAREPWRMAVSALYAAGGRVGSTVDIPAWAARHFPEISVKPIVHMLDKNLNCPQTSSLGRWFDAAAGLLGVCEVQHFEGQAAMWLEALAERYLQNEPGGLAAVAVPDGAWRIEQGCLDLLPLVAHLVEQPKEAGAALFHVALVQGLVAWVVEAAKSEGIRQLVLGGGCAMNSVLLAGLQAGLVRHGLELITARQVPPNDSGLALGQAWIARHRMQTMSVAE